MKVLVLVGGLLLAGPVRAADDPRPAPAPAVVRVIDLNTASAAQLCTLPGIGPKKAEAILARRAKKPFVRVTQLLEVKGIGPRTLARLRPLLIVGAAPAVTDAGPSPAS